MNTQIAESVPSTGIRQPGVLVWLRLARVFQKVAHAGTEQMREYGISMAQFDILAHVGANEGITQTRLANSLLVTKGNICQLLDRMECSGLLVRRQEGRANRLYLTDGGQSLFDQLVPAHEAMIARTFSVLPTAEQAQLLALLRTLDQALA